MKRHDIIVRVVARLLLTPSVVVAAALIVKEYAEVGDGFSAGMIVSLTVALQYVALGTPTVEEVLPLLRLSPALVIGGHCWPWPPRSSLWRSANRRSAICRSPATT